MNYQRKRGRKYIYCLMLISKKIHKPEPGSGILLILVIRSSRLFSNLHLGEAKRIKLLASTYGLSYVSVSERLRIM